MFTSIKFAPTELLALLLALPVVVIIRVGLWLLPSHVILRIVRLLQATPTPDAARSIIPVGMIVWAVEAVSRRIPRATCLTQAISAKLLLRAVGRDALFCIGVAHTGQGNLRAHAWLEREGRAVLGASGTQTLMRLPSLTIADVPGFLTR